MAAGPTASVFWEDVTDAHRGLAADRYIGRAATYRDGADPATDG
ncbi:MAG: hypothetical protein ABEH59_09710 [Halobacteriales archaeon]